MHRTLLALLLLSAATPLAAQELTAAGLFSYTGDMDAETLGRMEDHTVILLSRLLGKGMGRASGADCARLLGGAADEEAFFIMITGVEDSLEAEEWATLLEEIMWAEVEERPASPMATPDEVMQTIVRLMLRTEGKEREFIVKVSQTDTAGCLLSPWMMDRLGSKSPPRAAYLIRGLLAWGTTIAE